MSFVANHKKRVEELSSEEFVRLFQVSGALR